MHYAVCSGQMLDAVLALSHREAALAAVLRMPRGRYWSLAELIYVTVEGADADGERLVTFATADILKQAGVRFRSERGKR